MRNLKQIVAIIIFAVFITTGCNRSDDKIIKSFCLDFNWGKPGSWSAAEVGEWAETNPEEQIKWYKDLGVNVIQTFCVSWNGYAWYKNGIVPEQPGLKYDYLPEMVRLGHKENMKVMGYFTIGSNPRWGALNPDYSYGSSPKLTPGLSHNCHIPYTNKYLAYLDSAIRDAVKKTGIDGFLIDWAWLPTRESTNGKWIDCEKKLFEELMKKPFPGEEKLSEADNYEYSKLAIEKCWDVIHTAAKETNPDCVIWLSCNDPKHPHVKNSRMFKEIDWLMNEAGDLESLKAVESMIGKQTKQITCFAEWNKVDAKSIIPNAIKTGIGLYGFAQAGEHGLRQNIDHYLSLPIDSFKSDDRNIATLARAYNGFSFDYIKKK